MIFIDSLELIEFSNLIKEKKCNSFKGELKTGIDLGTANIVISVVDSNNNPVAGASYESTVVKDGIVVDFLGAISILKNLKSNIEEMLGEKLTKSAIAIPPKIVKGNIRCIANVVESAGFEVVNVVEEPTAASKVLNIKNGAVVDVWRRNYWY